MCPNTLCVYIIQYIYILVHVYTYAYKHVYTVQCEYSVCMYRSLLIHEICSMSFTDSFSIFSVSLFLLLHLYTHTHTHTQNVQKCIYTCIQYMNIRTNHPLNDRAIKTYIYSIVYPYHCNTHVGNVCMA